MSDDREMEEMASLVVSGSAGVGDGCTGVCVSAIDETLRLCVGEG